MTDTWSTPVTLLLNCSGSCACVWLVLLPMLLVLCHYDCQHILLLSAFAEVKKRLYGQTLDATTRIALHLRCVSHAGCVPVPTCNMSNKKVLFPFTCDPRLYESVVWDRKKSASASLFPYLMDCVCFTQFIHLLYLLTANYLIEPYIDVYKGASSFIPGGKSL